MYMVIYGRVGYNLSCSIHLVSVLCLALPGGASVNSRSHKLTVDRATRVPLARKPKLSYVKSMDIT